jgi:hypothetical protein
MKNSKKIFDGSEDMVVTRRPKGVRDENQELVSRKKRYVLLPFFLLFL